MISARQKQFLGVGLIVLGIALSAFSVSQLLGGDGNGDAIADDLDDPTATEVASATEVADPTTAPETATPSPTPVPATATPTPEPTPVTFSTEDVATFLADLRASGSAQDIDRLMSLLHPAVFARYGEANCRTYLEVTPLALDVTVREVLDPAAWDWITDDGDAGRFDEAIEVEITRLVGSQTLVQILHLVPLDGELKWLTDCGEPAP